mmetsp:Transcript_66880/g.185207  ORF Transcript_66880/g.185207 Transcript_66880/m.185207 type:complete len:308 (+) Transcript_66880:76-999(+)
MGANIGAEVKRVQSVWSDSERASYIASSGIICPTGEEGVQRFLADAIVLAPLPAPWVMMHRRQKGEFFFVDRRTGLASWSHPLEPCLWELAEVCRKCLELPSELRGATISGLQEKWEAEARGEYRKWRSVEDPSGQIYYCHQDTGEAMWEHPAEALLPAHYIRIVSIEMLRSDGYMMRIRSRSNLSADADAAFTLSRRCSRRKAQESLRRVHCPEAFHRGDPEADSDAEPWAHLCIDVPDSDDDDIHPASGATSRAKEADHLSSCGSARSTETFFIGDSSDSESSEADEEPWPRLLTQEDGEAYGLP